MHSVTIRALADFPEHSKLVAKWLHLEWGIDRDEGAAMLPATSQQPGALLACNDGNPVGALVFKRYQATFQRSLELWINGVYVVPNNRRRGVGRQLVLAAGDLRTIGGSQELFAYTDIPDLYRSCGWESVLADSETKMHTLVLRPSSEE